MASYTAIENTPIMVNLLDAAIDTGWTISGSVAVHVSCNSGRIRLLGFQLIAGQQYRYTYQVISITSGGVNASLGDTDGAIQNTTGFVDETLTATGDSPIFTFYSDGNCSIQEFTIQQVQTTLDNKAQNTISFSEKSKKWVSFYSYVPDIAFSLFTNIYSFYQGDLYLHESGTGDRNTFYGTEYPSIIQFVDNNHPALPKQFMSLSLQSNELLITTEDGITSSLGQISELGEVDFIKSYLSDGVSTVNVSAMEGVYSANFLRDKNDDLLNGTPLRGNYMIVELISTNQSVLQFYTVNIVSRHSSIGAR